MSVYVVNVERVIEGTEVIGVYVSEKLAKGAAAEYIEETDETFKKKQVKKSEDARKVLYREDTSENPTIITLTCVGFEMPGKKVKKVKDPNAPKRGLSSGYSL